MVVLLLMSAAAARSPTTLWRHASRQDDGPPGGAPASMAVLSVAERAGRSIKAASIIEQLLRL